MTTTKAAVATAIPTVDTIEMILTAECDFRAKRYLSAMRNETVGFRS